MNLEPLDISLGKDDIKSLRKAIGMSYEEFARALNCSVSTCWRWETGERSPSLRNRENLRSAVVFLMKQQGKSTKNKEG